jgi:hypothetical protein
MNNNTNYDSFISRLYKYGTFIACNQYIRLCLKCNGHVTYLHMIFLFSDTFYLEYIEYDKKIVPIHDYFNGLLNTIVILSKYLNTNIYEPYDVYKVIQH